MKKDRKIKNILINPKFQLKLMGLFGLLIFAVTLTYAIAIHLVLEDFVVMGKSAGLNSGHIFFDFISKQRSTFLNFFLVTFSGVTVVFLYVGFVLSHRIAGPMYRLKKHMDEISQTGSLKSLKFRKDDFFQEVADSFNAIVEERNNKN